MGGPWRTSKWIRKYGETLASLAQRYGVSMHAITNWDRKGGDLNHWNRELILRRRYRDPRLRKVMANIRQRCGSPNDPKYHCYGGRGIKTFLTFEDVVFLWNRDRASAMHQPSIDRININGNYERSNCRFIELNENCGQRRKK